MIRGVRDDKRIGEWENEHKCVASVTVEGREKLVLIYVDINYIQ